MKNVTKEVQIKYWQEETEKENPPPVKKQKSYLQGSNFFASILCKASCSLSLLSFFSGHSFILSLPQPLLWSAGSEGKCVTLKDIFIFITIVIIVEGSTKLKNKFGRVRVITCLQLLTHPLSPFFASFNLIYLTWDPLIQQQSWIATSLKYQSLLPEKSLVLACAHSQHTTSLGGATGNCHFSCSINCPLVKESRTWAVPGWWGKKKIFPSQTVIKLSWTVTCNCHLEEADIRVCFSPV